MSQNWKAVEVLPTLAVANLEEALDYYRRLGFEKEWSYPADDEPTQVGLSLGKVNLMLALCHDGSAKIERQNLYFVMTGIDSFHDQLRDALGEAVPEMVDSDYGMRDFGVCDPWGHLLTFGEAAGE